MQILIHHVVIITFAAIVSIWKFRYAERFFELPGRKEWVRMEKKMLFIFNPKAGKAQIRNKLLDILDVFAKGGYEVTACPTQCQGDGLRIAKEKSQGFDIVVCSGGDGTLDEVVSGMLLCETKRPIGYIPAGSTNDFAESLGLSKNMIRAAEDVVCGDFFACDIGSFNEDSFVYIAAFGIFTDVSYGTNQDVKNVLGHMAYILEGMRRLPAMKAFPMKISWDDEVLEDDFLFGMVTNSRSVGGFKRITGKHVELDDGLFEVTLIRKPANPLELNVIIAALLNRNINTEHIYCFMTKKISFFSENQISWTLDGEYGGSHGHVVIENMSKAIEIKVPK